MLYSSEIASGRYDAFAPMSKSNIEVIGLDDEDKIY
jgi:hypothetical protein